MIATQMTLSILVINAMENKMKVEITVVEPRYEWTDLSCITFDLITKHIEECGRTCYKSEQYMDYYSANKFVKRICRNNHESVLEHATLTSRIICSRACSHQLVRHRIAAYSQESMRYCNYGKKGLQVICPPSIGLPRGIYVCDLRDGKFCYSDGYELIGEQADWLFAIGVAYSEYLSELDRGIKPEDARFILPNATKTEVMTTMNLRMWRHVIRERAINPKAQWEIRSIFSDIHKHLKARLPAVFGDL
jgi:thymidylate synthase (FAD)